GRFKDPVVDQLFEQQKVERDAPKRAQLVKDMQKRIMDKAWEIIGLWWTRTEVRSARLHNYEPQPSHWLNRRLEDVWLSAKWPFLFFVRQRLVFGAPCFPCPTGRGSQNRCSYAWSSR